MATPLLEALVTPRLEIPPTLMLPAVSRLTIALDTLLLVGGTFQFRLSVPLLVTGEPLTVKSDEGAANATLLTVPVPGNACPEANEMIPLFEIVSPVSAGVVAPDPKSRFSLPSGAAVLFSTGSACQRKVWVTALSGLLLYHDAGKLR